MAMPLSQTSAFICFARCTQACRNERTKLRTSLSQRACRVAMLKRSSASSYTYEVVDARDDTLVEMTVTEPFPMHVRYELASIDANATKVAIHARGDASGFFRLMSPIMNRMVRRNIRR